MSSVATRAAIQGESGSFSHAAARALLGPEFGIVCCESFAALFAALESGQAQRAVLPIENSLHGSIHENYDRLAASGAHIVGETQLRIGHCLVGRPGSSLQTIRRVASHAVALSQCRRFFAEHPEIEAQVAYDTAGAVRDLLRGGLVTQAAIASRLAADLYGGQVLLEGLEDDPANFTRFLLLSRTACLPSGADKTTLVFSLRSRPGALHEALGAFARRGVDLSKIESRPLRGRPWQYAFYLDVLGDPQGLAGEAVAELRAAAEESRVLGSYVDGLRQAATARPDYSSEGM